MPDLEQTALTDLEQIRSDAAHDLDLVETELHERVDALAKQIDTPHGHMLFGVVLFVTGLLSGVILPHLF